jgi:hypothetical protein
MDNLKNTETDYALKLKKALRVLKGEQINKDEANPRKISFPRFLRKKMMNKKPLHDVEVFKNTYNKIAKEYIHGKEV